LKAPRSSSVTIRIVDYDPRWHRARDSLGKTAFVASVLERSNRRT
jgi:hypothetical protein